MAEAADANAVLVLVRSYAAEARPFDGNLDKALRRVTLGERPSTTWGGAREVFGVPIPGLRRDLFRILQTGGPEADLAARSLTAIDELRDEYGQPNPNRATRMWAQTALGHG